jgi:uncharacterized membrane protein YwaF
MPVFLFILISFLLGKQNSDIKRNVLLIICIFNILLYISYKIIQANNPEYNFNIFTNLPLHFCNINLILLPIAIFSKNKYLLAYQLYFGTPLALLALVTIDPSFRSKPFFEYTSIVYFYYHSMLAIIPFLLLKYKLFIPSYKNVLQPVLLLISITFIAHIVNIIFRVTRIAEEANYFFTYGLKGDFFTEFFWNILPYNFFFLLPSILLFLPYIILITLPFHLKSKKKINSQEIFP